MGPSPPPTSVSVTGALDRALLSGIAWTGVSRWGLQVLSWVATIVVARILNPSDYGIVGMAGVYLGLVQLVNDFGFSSAIVQQRHLRRDQLSIIAGWSLALGAGLCLLSIALAPLVAGVLGDGRVRAVIQVSSASFLIGGLQIVPRALLTRDHRFRPLATIDLSEAAVSLMATLFLALAGAGYWSLVIGGLCGRAVNCSLTLVLARHPVRFTRHVAEIRETIAFGTHMILANAGFYLYVNADAAILGRLAGPGPLGQYALAKTIGQAPIEKLYQVLARVVPTILAAAQDDLEAVRRYLLRMTTYISLVSFPSAIGLAIVSGDLVTVLLGQKWAAAAPALSLLALSAVFRSLSPLLVQGLVATGHPSLNARFTLLAALVIPALIALTAPFGITAVAAVWLVAFPILSILTVYRWSFRLFALSPRSYLTALLPASRCSAGMAAVALGSKLLMSRVGPQLRLTTTIASGVLAYVVLLFWLERKRVTDLVRFVRGARPQQVTAPP